MADAVQKQNPFRLSARSVVLIEQYCKALLEYHKRQNGILRDKLTDIDVAYARYKIAEQTDSESNLGTGKDLSRIINTTVSGITEKEITVPVVISQVDSFVGYLADVYLSGYPMFPVVSEPNDMEEAAKLEAIIDTTTLLGAYPRHLLMSFRDAMKYNFMPVEIVWDSVDRYDLVSNYLNPRDSATMQANSSKITKINRLDPYNTIYDSRVDPVNVSYCGEFAGYIEIIPRLELKRFINRNSTTGDLYNLGKIQAMSFVADNYYFTDLPTISDYVQAGRAKNAMFDWGAWLGTTPQAATGARKTLKAGTYERTTFYCRIIPSEFEIMSVPKPNSPQIWKFIFINGQTLLQATPIYTVFDTLPISISQPLEDGFGLQTKSIGEAQMPMQDAASTLFNIRFNAARRAVSDRALYDPTLINPSDVNSIEPAAKIPVRLSGLNDKDFSRAYESIPFNDVGTAQVMSDARNVLEMADQLSGLNKPNRGQFQKGNKSVQEWQDTMGGADNRLRLPALSIEFQLMIPLKEQIKQNIYQYGVSGAFQSFKTGDVYNIKPEDIDKLKSKVLSFRVADGYTPKAKMASTDFLATLIQSISTNQLLAQSWGPALPRAFAHLAQLGGVRGLDQYLPKLPAPQQGATQPAQGQNGPGNQPTPPIT